MDAAKGFTTAGSGFGVGWVGLADTMEDGVYAFDERKDFVLTAGSL
jgi:hypothetical protein